ncbi:MAG: heparinase II/III family protein [Hyphomicrobiaceae bacterium]|nr:heparinase II/III family protein [Hyphomicrobiaceae bacterium]
MARLTMQERLQITAISAERKRRGFLARALSSRTLRWRYGGARVDQLLIVPQDLRLADPSFWLEIQHGQFGLAGSIARLDGQSPFAIVPPGRNWVRALNGFGWLRHLAATEIDDARMAARQLAMEWVIREAKGAGESWRPDVLARRVISWLSHASLLLEGADERTYDAIATSLGTQLLRLSSAWREAPAGQPRMLALTALVLADLCVAGRDRRLRSDLPLFLEELKRQILPDGGHVSRNPALLVELLLDLLPLRQCFRARGRQQPVELDEAISSMLAMLRFLRMGDGLLGRFNGVSVGIPARLATVLAYADVNEPPLARAPASGYQRIALGDTILLADCGGAPPAVLSSLSHAGCLSFELSCGTEVILSNSGAPGSAHTDWTATARATASHNTLVLGETSSAKLVGNRRTEDVLGGLPIRGPNVTRLDVIGMDDQVIGFEATHDGYLERYGIVHERRVVMENDGRRLVGIDHLKPPRGILRLKQDVPFSIHFHLHPGVMCELGDRVGTAFVTVAGQRWKLAIEGARLGIEESIYFADSAGPTRRLQVVARGVTFGETEVRWAMTRLA